LAQISIVIAGAVAEVVLDPAGCRAGFSIDEIIVGQLFCNQLGARLGIPGEKRWGICWWRTASVLEHNERTPRALMQKLDAAGIVRRKKLTGLTADVRKILPDPFDVINEGWRPNI